MHDALIIDLAIVTGVGAITAMICRRMGQPTILGYLMAGLLVGPYIPIPLFADPKRMGELAEVGVVLVMFSVGLEFRIKRLLKILPLSGLSAIVQIASLCLVGYAIGALLGWSVSASVCLGACLSISSTMVVSSVLRTVEIDEDTRTHVFGILVVQDVVAIVLMAVVTGLASGESLGALSIGLLILRLAGVVLGMLLVGMVVLPRLTRFALKLGDHEVIAVLMVGAAFSLAFVAHAFGFSVALGAFVAGIAVAESGKAHDVEATIGPIRSLFSAIFFVSIGMTVDPVVAFQTLPFALGLSVAVVLMQVVSVTVGTTLTGNSLRKGIIAGLALGQIGELSFILATIAIAGGVLTKETLSALVTVATVTAFTTPFMLRRSQHVVGIVDRLVPDRAQQLLAAYQSVLRSTMANGNTQKYQRMACALILDWTGLLVLLVVRSMVLAEAKSHIAVYVNAGAALIAVPLLVGLVRTGWLLTNELRVRAMDTLGQTPRAKAVQILQLLAVALGIGLPTLVIVSPLVNGPWIESVFVAIFVIILMVLALRLGSMKGKSTSGVFRIANSIAERVASDESEEHPTTTQAQGPLAGIEYQLVLVPENSVASGKSLAELSLRAKTGAMVIAIGRSDVITPLPTGHHIIESGDELAVSGANAAVERLRHIIASLEQTPRP